MPKPNPFRKQCLLCGPQDIQHFSFPRDPLFRTLWANFCNVEPTSVSINHKLCYRHFLSEDLSDNRMNGGCIVLRREAVPQIHLDSEKNRFSENIAVKHPDSMILSRISTSSDLSVQTSTRNVDSSSYPECVLQSELAEVPSQTLHAHENNSIIDYNDFDVENVTCDYSNHEEIEKTYLNLNQILQNLNKELKREAHKAKSLNRKSKRLKKCIEDLRKINASINIPPELLELSTEDIEFSISD